MDGAYDVPRQLWLYWHQGWERAPWLVRRCLVSWERENPSWTIHKLDERTAREHVRLPERLWREADLPLCALSDMIRIELLSAYGGVWADATVFCQRPLDEWIHEAAEGGFFAFDGPGPGRPLATWLLASAPRHLLIEEWKRRVRRLWIEEDFLERSRALWSDWTPSSCPEHYFWCHALFGQLIRDDPLAARLWDGVPKISADGPHFVQFSGMLEPLSAEVKAFIDGGRTPVHKLTFRYAEDLATPDSSLMYLMTR